MGIFVYDRWMNTMERVSKSSEGTPANGDSGFPDISSDGRWVVFDSQATNLTAENSGHIFIHDRQTGTTEVIDPCGGWPTLSADGRFVTCASMNRNDFLVVLLFDRQTDQAEQVSKPIDGDMIDGDSLEAQISADGRWVAFWSWASNLVPGDNGGCVAKSHNPSCGDVYLYDRENSQLQRIPVGEGWGEGMVFHRLSLSEAGRWVAFKDSVYDRQTGQVEPLCADELKCSEGVLSDDGQWVVFTTGADIFVQNRFAREPQLVSVASDGAPGNGKVVECPYCHGRGFILPSFDISGDGRWVVFSSTASNLALSDTQECSNQEIAPYNCFDIFVHDRETGLTEWVSRPFSE